MSNLVSVVRKIWAVRSPGDPPDWLADYEAKLPLPYRPAVVNFERPSCNGRLKRMKVTILSALLFGGIALLLVSSAEMVNTLLCMWLVLLAIEVAGSLA